jgi:hypothetical protein
MTVERLGAHLWLRAEARRAIGRLPLVGAVRLASIAALSLASASCELHRDRALQGRAADEWVRTYTLAEGGEFQIVGAGGTIDVQSGTGPGIDVRAERLVKATSDAMAQSVVSKVRIAEDVAPDKIVLRSEGLGGILIGVEIEINFHVTVPPSTRLRLRASNGNISLANLRGAIVASTTNGGITAKAIDGGIDARSTNGSVSVQLASVAKDPIDLRAVNGQIELTLPPTANANIEANSTNGTIDKGELPVELTGEQTRRRMRGRLNEGGAPIELTSTNGDIHLRAAR